MREHLGQGKKDTTDYSIPSLKHPIRGFGLESLDASPSALSETEIQGKPPGHDISKISLCPQAKMAISQPGDFYEQQADSIAEQIIRRTASLPPRRYVQTEQMSWIEKLQTKSQANLTTPAVQKQQTPQEEELQMKSADDSSWLQRQPAPEEELQMQPMVQLRQGAEGMAATSDLETSIQQSRGGGQPLADEIKQPMEHAFGADFAGVRIHTDAQSDRLN